MREDMNRNLEGDPFAFARENSGSPVGLPDLMKPIIEKSEGVMEEILEFQRQQLRFLERCGLSKAVIDAFDQARESGDFDKIEISPENGPDRPDASPSSPAPQIGG